MQLGYNISWDGFPYHVQGMLRDLNEFDQFTDVTIVCDDQKMLKAHRFILSASSDVFRNMLNRNSNQYACLYLPQRYSLQRNGVDFEIYLQWASLI